MTDQPKRIFKTGNTTIVEDESMRGLSNEAVKTILQASYPEIAHAQVRERTLEDGTLIITYLPRVGRKG